VKNRAKKGKKGKKKKKIEQHSRLTELLEKKGKKKRKKKRDKKNIEQHSTGPRSYRFRKSNMARSTQARTAETHTTYPW
jgi:hypothetical protein